MIGRIITRGRNSGLKCLSTALSPSSLTFPRYFSPKTESLFTGYVLGNRCVLKTPTLTNSVEKIHLKFNKSIFRAPGLKRLQRLKIFPFVFDISNICILKIRLSRLLIQP